MSITTDQPKPSRTISMKEMLAVLDVGQMGGDMRTHEILYCKNSGDLTRMTITKGKKGQGGKTMGHPKGSFRYNLKDKALLLVHDEKEKTHKTLTLHGVMEFNGCRVRY